MEKIQAHVGDPFVGSRHPALLLPEVLALRPLPELPGEFPLLPGKSLFRPFQDGDKLRRGVEPRSVREGGKGRHPEVQSDPGRGWGQGLLDLSFGLEGDGPAPGLFRDGGVPEIAHDLSGEADADPPDLGEEDPGMV